MKPIPKEETGNSYIDIPEEFYWLIKVSDHNRKQVEQLIDNTNNY